MKSFTNLIFISSLAIAILSGCSSTKVTPPSPQTVIQKQTAVELSADTLVIQANESRNPNKKALLLLAAAEKYFQNNQAHLSSSTLKNIDDSALKLELNPHEHFRLLLINLKLGVYEGLTSHLETSSELYSPSILERVNIEDIKQIVPLLAEAFHLQNRHIEASILLIEYSGILSTADFSAINEQIWSLLRTSDPTSLSSYNYTNGDQDVIAWLELARAITQHQIDLESQYLALKMWQKKWPNHPAAILPPTELRLLSKLPETRPSTITLALPFSGPVEQVGKAVRDGFMAAYYNASQNQDLRTLKISFFDTHQHSIEALFSAPGLNNELIIGPLTKAEVNKIPAFDLHETSVLALNYLDTLQIGTARPTPETLYQFGLNPDIEVLQIAELLNRKQQHNIAFIGPENELGFRLYDALAIELQNYNSQIIESIFYKEQNSLSNSVAKLLGTDTSKARKRHIQNITGINFEFEPRRRQDIEAIFMLAKPQIAKQLNPLFAYHYAGDLPIYSGSQIHQANEPKNDLDNIYFVDIPWMLSNTIDIKNIILDAIPSSANQYARFYALGADAFSLAPRLQLLKTVKDSKLQGQTGTLSINSDGIVNRKLEVAVFRKGRANVIKE